MATEETESMVVATSMAARGDFWTDEETHAEVNTVVLAGRMECKLVTPNLRCNVVAKD